MVDRARVARGIHLMGLFGLFWPLPVGVTITSLLYRKAQTVDAAIEAHARSVVGYQWTLYVSFLCLALLNGVFILLMDATDGLTFLLMLVVVVVAILAWLTAAITILVRAARAGAGAPATPYPGAFFLR